MKKLILILFLSCMYGLGMAQETAYLTGTVKDKRGTALPGAAVSWANGGPSVLADENGIFKIRAPNNLEKAVLSVSYLGYLSQRVAVSTLGKAIDLVLLEDPKQLQEVVVSTGYQQISKERATGAFEQIGQKIIDRSISTDLFGRLEGLSPVILFDKRGYNINNPQNNPQLLVRGLSSINASSSPLIVLDNFPFEGDVNSINPNDIASVTILKDAVASSIWGARAGNGVIVITTKKGSVNSAIQLHFNSNVSITGKPDLMAYPVISSSDYIATEQFLFGKGFYNSEEQSTGKPALSPVVEILIAQRDGGIDAATAKAKLDALAERDVRRDYLNEVYRKELRQQYALNLSGGGAQHAFYASLGYDMGGQSLKSNSNDRLSLKLENNFRPLKRLELRGNIQYSKSKMNSLNSNAALGYGQLRSGGRLLYPYASLVNADGSPANIEKDYRKKYTDALSDQLLNWDYYPLDELAMPGQQITNSDLLMDAGVKYEVLKWLKASINYRHQEADFELYDLRNADSYFTRNLINLYTQVSGNLLTQNIPYGSILNQSSAKSLSHQVRGQLDFSHSWKKHGLSGIAGAEIGQLHTVGDSRRVYGYNENLLTFQNVDYLTVFPAYDNLASSATIPSGTSFDDKMYRNVSLYANGAYTFNGIYSLTGSIRKDASNIFGVNTNQKWQPLWSLGGLWNLSKEKFYSLKFLPYLKLRASYGFAGNTDNSRSAYTTMSYYSGTNALNKLQYAYVVNPPNAALRWEKVRTLNMGLDFGSIGNRISGSVDVYTKKTTDLLGAELVDPLSGFTSNILNGASGKGKGFEVQLNSVNLEGELGWTTNLTLAYNRTKISKYEGNGSTVGLVGTGIAINPVEGYPVYPMFSYAWAGLDGANGDPIGTVDEQESKDYATIVNRTPLAELLFHGSAIPLYNGSLLNTFSYQQFSISANLSFRLNYFFRTPSISYTDLYNGGDGHLDFSQRWQKPGDEAHTHVPSMVYPADANRDLFYNYSSVLVEPGDHIRLQDIRFSYHLEAKGSKKMGFKTMELFVYANNLGILWQASKSGLDPDYGFNGIPPSGTYALGLKASF